MTRSIPKLYVLLASENNFALVLRRGPINRVAVMGWNRAYDTFTLGQWLKGRIDENFCDLSPNGRHFLYRAKKYEPTVGYEVFYTVMSRAPYLKAIHYWAPKHWTMGGAFFDNTRFWLSTVEPLPEVRTLPRFARVKEAPELQAFTSRPDVATYRRNRDGWVLQPDDYQRRNLWHKTQSEWTLALSIDKSREKLPNLYELKAGTEAIVSGANWTWADFDTPRNRLCFARDGQLWALDLKIEAQETLLHDFNGMQFEPLVAPY